MKEIDCPHCKGTGKIIISEIEAAFQKEKDLWNYPLTNGKENPKIYKTWDTTIWDYKTWDTTIWDWGKIF